MPDSNLDNPFIRFLEGKTPEAFLFAQMPGMPSMAQQGFAGGMATPLLNRFKGEVGRRALAGNQQDLMFSDWLGQNFNFGRQFRRLGGQPGQGITGPIRRIF